MALHHLVVLACFGASVTKSMFLGLTMVAMLMEVNSIFLHSRTLCLYSGLKNTNLYRFISISNIATLIVFRLMVSVCANLTLEHMFCKGIILVDDVVRPAQRPKRWQAHPPGPGGHCRHWHYEPSSRLALRQIGLSAAEFTPCRGWRLKLDSELESVHSIENKINLKLH